MYLGELWLAPCSRLSWLLIGCLKFKGKWSQSHQPGPASLEPETRLQLRPWCWCQTLCKIWAQFIQNVMIILMALEIMAISSFVAWFKGIVEASRPNAILFKSSKYTFKSSILETTDYMKIEEGSRERSLAVCLLFMFFTKSFTAGMEYLSLVSMSRMQFFTSFETDKCPETITSVHYYIMLAY